MALISAIKSTTNRPREYRQLDVTKYLRFAHAHPALISEEVFESAQKVLKHYKKRGGYKKKSPAYPLAGKIKCGYCGYSARLGGKAPFFTLAVGWEKAVVQDFA